MDWQDLIADNAAALLGLIGVGLGFSLNLVAQWVERHWDRADRYRAWLLDRKEKQTTLVLEWTNDWLRLSHQLIEIERNAVLAKGMGAASGHSSQRERDLRLRAERLFDRDATITPVISALGDEKLEALVAEFKRLRKGYTDALGSRNLAQGVEANRALLVKATHTISEMHARVDAILVSTLKGRKA